MQDQSDNNSSSNDSYEIVSSKEPVTIQLNKLQLIKQLQVNVADKLEQIRIELKANTDCDKETYDLLHYQLHLYNAKLIRTQQLVWKTHKNIIGIMKQTIREHQQEISNQQMLIDDTLQQLYLLYNPDNIKDYQQTKHSKPVFKLNKRQSKMIKTHKKHKNDLYDMQCDSDDLNDSSDESYDVSDENQEYDKYINDNIQTDTIEAHQSSKDSYNTSSNITLFETSKDLKCSVYQELSQNY